MDTLKCNTVCGSSDQYYMDELGIHLDIWGKKFGVYTKEMFKYYMKHEEYFKFLTFLSLKLRKCHLLRMYTHHLKH